MVCLAGIVAAVFLDDAGTAFHSGVPDAAHPGNCLAARFGHNISIVSDIEV